MIEAVRRIPKSERPAVWLEQTDEIEERSPENEKIISGIGFVGWPDTVADTLWYDANRKLKNGKSAYDFALLARRSHPSQFPDEISDKKVSTASPEAREVPLARLPTSISGNYCTDLALKRPTMDIPENRERLRKLLAARSEFPELAVGLKSREVGAIDLRRAPGPATDFGLMKGQSINLIVLNASHGMRHGKARSMFEP